MKRFSHNKTNGTAFRLCEGIAQKAPQNAAVHFSFCFLLALFCNVGLVFGVANSLGALVLPSVVFCFILFFTFLFCALLFLPRMSGAVWLLCFILYFLILMRSWEFFSQGFILTTNIVFQVLSDRGAGKLPQYIVTLGAQDWDSARLIFLLFLVFPFNALITVGIYRKNFFLVFVTVFLLFFPAMIYAITPPLWCLALIAASLGAAAVLSSLPKQLKKGNTFRAMLKNGICISLAALICFSGISVFYTTDFFQNDSLNNLRQVFSQLDFLYNSESSSMPASPVGSASSVDLSGEEGPVFTGETILRVKTNASHNLFLKAQSLEDYERDHWESNDSSINTSIDNSQLFTSLYLSTLRQSVESYEEPLPPLDKSLANFSSTMYSVEVEPVASNLQKMYLPYGFIERPWDVVSSAFFIGDSSVTPMSSRQENYTFSAYEVELSMLKNTPYWTERNLGQRDDEAYSGTHPFRRLSLQDYYLTSAGSYSAQYEDGYHFCSVESSYRNAYYERYTSIPTNLRTKLNELLEESCPSIFEGNVSHNETGERIYQAALQIQSLLNSKYQYTLNPDPLPDGTDATEFFLFESKEGYCVHFATAAVMLFRTLGIPARYAEGYLVQGGHTPDEWISVPDSSGHAWAEVYAPGFGWIPVEATPAVGLPETTTEPAATTSSTTETTEPITGSSENTTAPATEPDGSPIDEQDSSGWSLPLPVLIAFFALLGAACLVLLTWFSTSFTKKSREKRFHQPDRSKAVIAIYEYLRQLEPYAEIPQEALELAERAAFSQHSISPEEHKDMLRFADEAVQKTEARLSPLLKFWMHFFRHLI